ncbi:acyltransferase family protein [Rubrolithibacter danxiaensis]|uniref:acyltransferase family protein n=1 Tax=Rubrolithibacter danxiaensis TaxID=3390805 RepID=UPI003BF92769
MSVLNQNPNRLLSLDVMRGLIMILLAAESCMVYESLNHLDTGAFNGFINQFFHHPWHGLHFWDLIQPAFMTMAGSAMYISYHQKLKKGISWQQNFKHIAVRCLKLFLFGTGLHCIYAGKLVWELWNILTQLAFTTIIAYIIIRRSYRFQIVISIVLLLLTEFLYRVVLVPGFDQPFVEYHNFGAYFDTIIMGKINRDGWVAINIIPTAAHTIWGVLAGKLLISQQTSPEKIKWLVIAALLCLLIGFGLDLTGITPIIKRISTSSFVFASGGWVLLIMAFLYWLTDVKKVNKYAWVAVVVGTNAIFIYLFFETVGIQWLNGAVGIFVKGFIGMLGVPEKILEVISAVSTWFVEWYLCYWLFKQNIFFKI